MERRKVSLSKSSPLPADYVEMVTEVFTAHFDAGLKVYEQIKKNSRFQVQGEIYSDEILVSVSLVTEGQLSATTVYASCDFDPKASAPTVQDLLSACVDAIGTVFGAFLIPEQPEKIAKLGEESLSALENAPFDWTAIEADPNKIFVKVDKSNPKMDALAEEWLLKNDPEFSERKAAEQAETEKLFVTGPSSKNRTGGGSGMVH